MNKKQVVSIPLKFNWIGFGLDVKHARQELKLTAWQCGALVDISGSAVNDIENAVHGNALMSTVLALANLFDMDIREYFILSEVPVKKKLSDNKTGYGKATKK